MRSKTVTLHFSELLLVLLKGKTNLLDALFILTRDGINRQVRDSASSLLTVMKKGKSLSDSLRIIKTSKVFFEPLYLTLIATAEITGNIEAVLERIVHDLQRRHKAKENLINILIYPALIVLMAAGGTIALIFKGMPFFASGGLLSADAINDAKTGIGMAGIVLLLGSSALFYSYLRIFNNDSAESRIFYLLDLLLKSNVTLPDSLSQCIMCMKQPKHSRAIARIKKDIASGVSFSAAFTRTKCFSPYILGWLSIADMHGSLNEICASIRDYSFEKDNRKREAAKRLIEPAVILLVGIYVLMIMLTAILPILGMAGGIL